MDPMMNCWAMGIWIPSPVCMMGSSWRSLVLNARSFCSCIARDLVARCGLVWKPDGEGCAMVVVFAPYQSGDSRSGYIVLVSRFANSGELDSCDHVAGAFCVCGVMGYRPISPDKS